MTKHRCRADAVELDHLFLLVEPDGPEVSDLSAQGFQETYRREHPGQGTSNACFAFENLFLEFLWVTNESDLKSPAIVRTCLWERSQWKIMPACPFGFALRGSLAALGVESWLYRPPYLEEILPEGSGIEVALDSEDPNQPLVFSFPGSKAPCEWPEARRGTLQRQAGWSRVEGVKLVHPEVWAPGNSMIVLQEAGLVGLTPAIQPGFSLHLALTAPCPGPPFSPLVLVPCLGTFTGPTTTQSPKPDPTRG